VYVREGVERGREREREREGERKREREREGGREREGERVSIVVCTTFSNRHLARAQTILSYFLISSLFVKITTSPPPPHVTLPEPHFSNHQLTPANKHVMVV
jgi:hypothetical protein